MDLTLLDRSRPRYATGPLAGPVAGTWLYGALRPRLPH